MAWAARGHALITVIDAGHIAAGGPDCFKVERGANPAFSAHDNIFMLPHNGSAKRPTRDAMGFCALDNLGAFFAGQRPHVFL